jgi:hypothetical protein
MLKDTSYLVHMVLSIFMVFLVIYLFISDLGRMILLPWSVSLVEVFRALYHQQVGTFWLLRLVFSFAK